MCRYPKLSEHYEVTWMAHERIQNPTGDLEQEELVRRSLNNVLVETLQAGKLGLPVHAEPTYHVGDTRMTTFS